MAVLAMILPLVSRSSNLSFELFRAAAESQEVTSDFITVAQVINHFASILKQIGTIIKEDDRLPSHQAIEILEDVIEQSSSILTEIDTIIHDYSLHERDDYPDLNGEHSRHTSSAMARLEYLASHLEALRTTLSVLLQTLFTAQSIRWSKLRPTISPQQTSAAVANEKLQLEALIIEQQMAILKTSILFEQESWNNTRLLTETDTSLSLVSTQRGGTPTPVHLYRYQYQYIAGLNASGSTESDRLKAVCSSSSPQSERLIELWTSLPDFYQYLQNAEREAQKQKQELQQPTVESDSEDDEGRTKFADNGMRMRPQTAQPLFSDANILPIPMPSKNYGPTAPLSPAASPKTSRSSYSVNPSEQTSPTSPRSSIASLPVNAAAAMEAKDDDGDVELEIPWTLCTRKYYWKFIDGKQIASNTEQHSSLAFLERNSWTEIMASWVCKEAIREADYRFTQVQKDVRDGRRTKFETCFCIDRPLQFDQVKLLVERTVEIYRRTAARTPPPQARRSSFHRPPPPPLNTDRNRTPVSRNTHPPLERSMSNMPMPMSAPIPPPMDRSLSMPGVPQLHAGPKSHTANLQIPFPPQGYAVQPPLSPHSPRMMQYATQPGSYSPHISNPHFQQLGYPLTTTHGGLQSLNMGPTPMHNQAQSVYPPPGYAGLKPPRSRYEDAIISDSEEGEREREKERARRHRSKSRSRYSSGQRKKSHGTSAAVGTLMGIGGLTALLDGLSGL